MAARVKNYYWQVQFRHIAGNWQAASGGKHATRKAARQHAKRSREFNNFPYRVVKVEAAP